VAVGASEKPQLRSIHVKEAMESLATGFDPEKMRGRGVWDKEKLIMKIRTMHQRHLPLYAKYVMANHGKLFKAALRQIDSWAKLSLLPA
jgi:hypothetical protein